MNIIEQIRDFLANCPADKKPLLAVVGPTASGKTALSITLAKAFNGEIISADSRQIYKHMDIGTDKIMPAAMAGIRHHLIDIISPDSEFTLSDFKRMATRAIGEIQSRQKLPIICGGTGLYINSVIDNYQIPQVPPQFALRQELSAFANRYGALALHQRLAQLDQTAAASIHPHNVRYVIRALEINLAGQTRKIAAKGERIYEVFQVAIDWPREVLYARINERINQQMGAGLIEEVQKLLGMGYDTSLPSMSSLGYSEIGSYLEGKESLSQAVEHFKQNTRNYCKRQMTWFRRNKDIHWIDGLAFEKTLAILSQNK